MGGGEEGVYPRICEPKNIRIAFLISINTVFLRCFIFFETTVIPGIVVSNLEHIGTQEEMSFNDALGRYRA